jgi:hypothetical protein
MKRPAFQARALPFITSFEERFPNNEYKSRMTALQS